MAEEDPRIGLVLHDRYRIVSRIATGAMGVIYLAERLQLGRALVVKVLQPELACSKTFLQRFEVEAQAISRMVHPNCVSIIDFGVADGPYLVMEYVQGETLSALVARDGALEPARALHIFRQLLGALGHAHAQGIIHRDVKPSNIVLTEATGMGDHIKILDFGLARVHAARDADHEPDKVTGTPFYMSPEQARGEEGDARSDLYSAGVLLFELLTGTRPFVADQMLDVLRMHRQDPPPTLNELSLGAKFSGALEAVIARALAKDPAQRFQSAQELGAALDATPEASLPLPRSPASKGAPAVRSPTHVTADRTLEIAARVPRWALFATIGVLASALVGVTVWLASGGGAAPEPQMITITVGDDPDQGSGGGAAAGSAASGASRGAEVEAGGDRVPTGTDAGTPRVVVTTQNMELADAKALLAQGQPEAAIRGLRHIRLREPQNAEVHYLLGKLYFDRHWWSEGMKFYAQAVRLDRRYASERRVIGDMIDALASDSTADRAEEILRKDVGWPALRLLSLAAERHTNPQVRKRARRLARQLAH